MHIHLTIVLYFAQGLEISTWRLCNERLLYTDLNDGWLFFKRKHNYSMFHCIPFPPCNIRCPICGVPHVLWQIQLISDCSEWQNHYLPHIGFWWRRLSFHFYMTAICVIYMYVYFLFVNCKQLCSCCINFLVFLPNINNFIIKIPEWAC